MVFGHIGTMPLQLVLLMHIGAGSIALLSGVTALSYRKGSRVHRGAGNVFFGSMLLMSVLGGSLALLKPDFGTAIMALLTFYLVATGWLTVIRREGESGRLEVAAMLVAWAIAALALALGLAVSLRDGGVPGGYPAVFYFVIAGIVAALAVGDVRLVIQRGIAGARRLRRHLWRMCFALLISALAFFIGQQDEFPDFIRGSPLLQLPQLAVLAAAIYWLIRVSRSRR